ncbi:MAG: MFS transporter [Candidatus Heimdallarchaeaceae archaeon]
MPEVRSPNPKSALFLLIFGHFLNHFLAYVLTVSLYILAQDIPMSKAQAGLVGTVQIILTAVFTFAIGIISDRWLKSKTLFIPLGIVLMAVSLFIAAMAQSYYILIISAVIVGIGASFYHPVAYAAIADLFETKKGITMALNTAFGMIGTSIAPGLIGSMDKWIGWRNAYYIFGVLNLVIGFAIYYSFEKLIIYSHSTEEIDIINHRKATMNLKQRMRRWLTEELVPVLNLMVIICLVYGIFRSAVFRTTNQFLPFIFNEYYNYNLEQAGWLSSVILIIGGFTSLLGGAMSDRYTTSLTMFSSSLGISIMLLFLWLFAGRLEGIWVIVVFLIFAAFLYFSAAAQTKYVTENVPKRSRSTGVGILFAIGSALSSVFPWIFGDIVDKGGYVPAFLFIFFLAFIALILSSVLLLNDFFKMKKHKS